MITKVPNQYTELIPFEPILDKQKSVGGNSSRSSTTTTTTKKGYNSSSKNSNSKNSNSCSCVFDSGCNLSGLRRVHIDVRPHKFIETTDGVLLFYPSAIRRIVFEFHDGRLEPSLLLPGGQQQQQQQCGTADCDVNDDKLPSSSSSSTTSTRSTLTTSTRSTLTTSSTDAANANTNNTTTTMCVLEVSGGKNKNNDAVASIDVWSDDVQVNAVQFRMKSGKVSQLFGTYRYSGETTEDDDEPADATAAATATTFRPKDSSWKLVGVHGSINSDNVVGRLGFTFATSAYERHTS